MLKILNLSMKFRSFRISFEIFCRFALSTLRHCWGNLGVKELTDSPGLAASGDYRSVACEEQNYCDEDCPVVRIIPEFFWNEISRETGTQDVGSELSWRRRLPSRLLKEGSDIAVVYMQASLVDPQFQNKRSICDHGKAMVSNEELSKARYLEGS